MLPDEFLCIFNINMKSRLVAYYKFFDKVSMQLKGRTSRDFELKHDPMAKSG